MYARQTARSAALENKLKCFPARSAQSRPIKDVIQQAAIAKYH